MTHTDEIRQAIAEIDAEIEQINIAANHAESQEEVMDMQDRWDELDESRAALTAKLA